MFPQIQGELRLKVKVVTDGSQPADLVADNILFSPSLDYAACDAVLSYHPNEEFLRYPGLKAWYCGEARANWIRATRLPWKGYLKRLRPEEFLTFDQEDPRYRVPHPTHWDGPLPSNHAASRLPRAVAVVSNHEPVWKRILKRRFEAIRRSRFVVNELTDLYGSRKTWERFRGKILSRATVPHNYRGAVPGSFSSQEKITFLARYKVCICLENACEALYFTEKFVDAARAGCVPVYHAHPTVRDGVLQGAKWIEAADCRFDPLTAINLALHCDLEQLWLANDRWLDSAAVRATGWTTIHQRIGSIMLARKSGAPKPVPEPSIAPVSSRLNAVGSGAESRPDH